MPDHGADAASDDDDLASEFAPAVVGPEVGLPRELAAPSVSVSPYPSGAASWAVLRPPIAGGPVVPCDTVPLSSRDTRSERPSGQASRGLSSHATCGSGISGTSRNCRSRVGDSSNRSSKGVGPVAVGVLVDAPAVLLLQGLDAVRDTPAPLGLVPARLGVLARAAAELQGVYLRELDRAERDGTHRAAGCRSTADLLVDTAGLPVSQARSDTALARRLGLVPGLLDALAGGGLELAAARLVAKAFAALPARLRDTATAGALISLAGLVDLADLKAKVDELCAALAPDVTDSDLADARETGELTLTDVGAQTRLGGHTDALTGEWLRDVLAAKAEADRGLADPRTSGQRLLDALLDCVRVAIDAGAVPMAATARPDPGRRQHRDRPAAHHRADGRGRPGRGRPRRPVRRPARRPARRSAR